MTFVWLPLAFLEDAPFGVGAPKVERVIAGTPTFRTWTFEESADGKTFAGVWESTPGSWRISYDEWECCSIVSGISIVVPDGEPPQRVTAGDAFVIQTGFVGTWEVVETTRKLFVVRLP
jgi:uncharacterized protein